MQHWREDCLQRLARPDASSEQVFAELAGICMRLGFDYCSFGVRVPLADGTQREAWSTTYPAAWRERYLAQEYLRIDPVIAAALNSETPLVWDDALFARQREFWEDARGHDVRHGWTLALRGRGGETGLLSLARGGVPVSAAELEDVEARLLWLAHTTNSVVGSKLALQSQAAASHELTPRECEVLRWTAAGKTAAEIGRILGVSARTINFHVNAALIKLDAVNKTQAVVKAVMFDLLR